MRWWALGCCVLLYAVSTYGAEYTTQDLLQMTQESLYADWEEDVAHALGVGRIARNNPQGVLLARRGALANAGRGLLLLRQELLKGSRRVPLGTRENMKLSGHIPPLKLLSESVRDGIYFVEVEAKLSTLLSAKGRASLNEIQSLRVENEQ